MRSTLRLAIIAGVVVLLTFATTITNRGFAARAIVFNGTNQYARVTLPNSAPWTSLGAFKVMGRARGMSSISGYIFSVGIPEVSQPFNLFQSGSADPKRIDLYDSRAGTQIYHAPNTFTDVVFKIQYDPANLRWTFETWKADGTGYVPTHVDLTTAPNWNLGGQFLTLGANPYGVGLSDAHLDWWCWQQGADALGIGNFPGAEVPTGTFLLRYTFDNDNGTDSSGNGLNLTLQNAPAFENTPGGAPDTTPPTISNISHNPSSSSAIISWNTNELATSRVFYDTVSRPSDTDGSLYAQASATDTTADNTSHSVTLTGLTSSTTYFYKIRSADAAGNAAFSTERSFPTSASGTTPTFVRLITANVQHGVGTDGVTNYTRQINLLTRDTDIVCLQERGTTDTGWNSGMAAQGFVERAYRENDPSQGDGPSIWVRSSTVTFNQAYDVALSQGAVGLNGEGVNKAAVAVKVTVAGKQFYVVNTHLCWSACADSSGSQFSVTRVNQINTLLNWINTTLTGGLDVLIVGDMNFGPAYPKTTESSPVGITTQRGIFLVDYDDLWEKGINTGRATAVWPDRNGDGVLDMPITVFDSGGTNNTRTHDERRIDYFFLKKTASTLALHNIDLPDLRAGCGALDPNQMWGFADDLGVRPSDHNWMKLTLLLN